MSHVTSILHGARKFVVDHSPMILTGMAIAGVATTAILAAKAAPHAYIDIQHAESEREEPLTNVEKVKLTYVHYIPAVVTGGLTIGCIVMANSVHTKRQAAFLSAYTLVENRMREYEAKVVDHIGEKKEQAIRDDIAQDYVNAHPTTDSTLIINDTDEQLFIDMLSGRKFKSTVDKVRKAENQLNFGLNNEAYMSLNSFYGELNIPHIPMGSDLGWKADRPVEVRLSAALDGDNAVITVDFTVQPTLNYDKLW